jgi:hypothetical protein
MATASDGGNDDNRFDVGAVVVRLRCASAIADRLKQTTMMTAKDLRILCFTIENLS